MPRDKRERFVALAEARTARALHDIRLLSNLANRNNYDYGPEDVAQIVKALEFEIKALKDVFAMADRAGTGTFKLKTTTEK